MSSFALLTTIARETFGPRTLQREPEATLTMKDAAQVAAFDLGGRVDGPLEAAYLFNAARISQIIRGRRRILDVGCGPGNQLTLIAALNPNVDFVGVDLSEPMLAAARRRAAAQGLRNLRFERRDMTDLRDLPRGAFDGAISTLALHQLPDEATLRACLMAVGHVLEPDAAAYLFDFALLKSAAAIRALVAQTRSPGQPDAVAEDYERSLRAAFDYDVLTETARRCLPTRIAAYRTAPLGALAIVKTPDLGLDAATRRRIRDLAAALPPHSRRMLDEMRLFFRFGGLRSDPFAAA